jgi:hypothetical protein
MRSNRPARIVFLDCDSDSETLPSGNVRETFKSASLISARRRGREYVVSQTAFTSSDTNAVWDTILSQTGKRSRTLVVSPKPVRVLTLLQHVSQLQQRGWALNDPVSSSRFTAISWRNDSRVLLFVAHGNLFPMQRLDNSSASRRVQTMCDTWIEYLRLLDENDCGDFHLSLGAQALSIYRHRFMQHPILISGDKRADELEQRACLGALYQPYWSGVAPGREFYYLDTNAMYPWCMKRYPYPWRLAGVVGRSAISLLISKLQLFDVIASVRLNTNEPRYPARLEGRTVFPVGEFTTTLTTPDAWHAFEAGHIAEIYALAWYDRAFLFTEFVNYWWNVRREFRAHGKPLWAAWAKSVMVSLYGRFGCHEFETRDEGQNPLDYDTADRMASLDSDEVRWYHTLAGRMWSSSRSGVQRDAFPAIMAHVAAYGRNRMFQLIERAGRDNVFVALSDGLIVNREGYDRLEHEIQPDSLGMLKLKLSGDELEILSDVEFRLNVHTWRPGVKPDAIQVQDGVFVQYIEPGLPGLARAGNTSEYVRRSETLTLMRQIETGRVEVTGRVVPLALPRFPPAQPRTPPR